MTLGLHACQGDPLTWPHYVTRTGTFCGGLLLVATPCLSSRCEWSPQTLVFVCPGERKAVFLRVCVRANGRAANRAVSYCGFVFTAFFVSTHGWAASSPFSACSRPWAFGH